MRITTAELTLTRKDAVFGRGRKRDSVRKGSLYRHLIEKYWKHYSDLDATKSAMREVFVRKYILDALVSRGGRFIVRSGANLSLLTLKDAIDKKLILKKVRRALFNEKKRQETKQNRKFLSKKLIFDMDDDDEDDDLEDSVDPVSDSTGDEDDGMEAASEQDNDFESEEEDREEVSFGMTTRSARAVSPPAKAKRVSNSPDVDWDFKLVQRARTMMDTTIMPPFNAEARCGDFDAEDHSTMTDDDNAVIVVKEYNSRRSSVKLDQLAKLACSLLFSEDDNDEESDSMPAFVIQKAKQLVAIKEEGLGGARAAIGEEDKKLAVIADDWDSSDKKHAAIVKDNTIPLKKPDPPVDSSDVAFTVVDSSKPLKKRAYHSYRAIMVGTMGQHNSFWMKRCSLEPRIADFEQHCEEHLFGAL